MTTNFSHAATGRGNVLSGFQHSIGLGIPWRQAAATLENERDLQILAFLEKHPEIGKTP